MPMPTFPGPALVPMLAFATPLLTPIAATPMPTPAFPGPVPLPMLAIATPLLTPIAATPMPTPTFPGPAPVPTLAIAMPLLTPITPTPTLVPKPLGTAMAYPDLVSTVAPVISVLLVSRPANPTSEISFHRRLFASYSSRLRISHLPQTLLSSSRRLCDNPRRRTPMMANTLILLRPTLTVLTQMRIKSKRRPKRS